MSEALKLSMVWTCGESNDDSDCVKACGDFIVESVSGMGTTWRECVEARIESSGYQKWCLREWSNLGMHKNVHDLLCYLAGCSGLRDIEVGTVDAFQGRQKDVILVSCVRANKNKSIGCVTYLLFIMLKHTYLVFLF